MRAFVFGVLVSVFLGSSVVWAENRSVETVIEQQIEAFKADDFATAFTFASPAIRRLFRNPENFGAMVTEGYPMVWRPADVTFLGLSQQNGRTIQKVLITDQSGVAHVLAYEMVKTENGWVINGVSLLGNPGASA